MQPHVDGFQIGDPQEQTALARQLRRKKKLLPQMMKYRTGISNKFSIQD